MAAEHTTTTAMIDDANLAKHVSSSPEEADVRRRRNKKMFQSILLIWLDSNLDENNADTRDIITQLKHVVSTVDTFINGDKCLQFLEKNHDEKAYIIISDSLAKDMVPRLHNLSQVDSIFIFSSNKAYHEQWTKEWPKMKGIFTEIESICDAIQQAVQQCEYNTISISLVPTSEDLSHKKLDQLDCTFMYTQIMKEILLTIDFTQEHIDEFIEHCHIVLADDNRQLTYVDKFKQTYHQKTPIWWYTCQCFLYPMLNRALRLMDADVIIKMGFFINDLHRHIERLHSEQFGSDKEKETFIVYRGQSMCKSDFEKLEKTEDGLLSFNNFLSTSENRNTSLTFAEKALVDPNSVGILFVMTINPARSSTPFASIANISYFKAENEVLFSMHTVFRINNIQPLDAKPRLFQVNMLLTSDNDPDLCRLTDRMREETKGTTGWYRLGELLIKLGQLNRAEEVYTVLLDQTTTEESETAFIFNQLGRVKREQGKYEEALPFSEKSLDIYEKVLPKNDLKFTEVYNDIGNVFFRIGDCREALSYYKKALTLREQSLPSNHPNLAASYNNIGNVYYIMGGYPKALSFHEKALVIREQSLSSNHPDLASSYNNIGKVYSDMGDYPKAFSSQEKALEIRKQSLPSYHPDLALSYNNIGDVYFRMGDYPNALSSQEKALAVREQSLPSNHSDLALSCNTIGSLYDKMGNYSKAQSYYERAVDITESF